MTGILSPGQWRLHAFVGLLVLAVIATSVPGMPHGVETAHRALGKLAFIAGLVLVVWHLRAALRTRHGAAVVTGALVVLLTVAVVATGMMIPENADGGREQGPRGAHGLAALLVPLLYLVHRRQGGTKPGVVPWLVALASFAACALAATTFRMN
jgi:hypothetical protein